MLLRGTTAAAKNALDLLYDAQVLAEAGSTRAYSLAALAVEEAGKAGSLIRLRRDFIVEILKSAEDL